MSFFDGDLQHSPTPVRTRPHGNLTVLRIAVVALFAILIAQLVNMQIVKGDEYAERSRQNHITRKDILPTRGLIYDRNGNPLVENVGVFTAVVTPLFLPDSQEDRYRIYQRLEELIGVPALEVDALVKEAEEENREYIGIPVAKYLTHEQALMVEEASTYLPGVSVDIKPGRNYIAGEAFSHILGYVGDQTAENRPKYEALGYALNEPVGMEGVEAWYESALRGEKGYTAAEQDAQGQLIKALQTKDPVPGNSLKLSIDQGLQNFVAEYLRDTLGDSKTAAAVVMSPKTGEIYAMVSLPTYDNNIFNQPERNEDVYRALVTDEERKPLLNHALLPETPGSTFKLITAAAALQEGNITPETWREIPSAILEFKGENGEVYYFRDWKAHGGLNLYGAIAWSSNIYMYMASCGIPQEGIKGLGDDPEESAMILAYYARAFGLGPPTGVDTGGEFYGTIPTPEWRRRVYEGPEFNDSDREWYYANTCFMGIGQDSVTASPLQIARMTAAVANGGKLLRPHVMKEIISPDGEVVDTAKVEATDVPVDPGYLAVIREGMRLCVTDGACKLGAVDGWTSAGKTGTAEFFKDGVKLQHAWYTGFAPYEDPEVVVTVYYETGWGGDKAAPAASAILKYFKDNVQR